METDLMPGPESNGLAQRFQTDISEIKAALVKITDALQTLAVVEERVSTTQAALERAFGEISKIGARIEKLEADMSSAKITLATERVENSSRNVWVDRGIVAAVVTAAQVAGRKMGIIP